MQKEPKGHPEKIETGLDTKEFIDRKKGAKPILPTHSDPYWVKASGTENGKGGR